MEFWSDSFTGRSVVNEFSLRTHWIGENRYVGFGEETNILLMPGSNYDLSVIEPVAQPLYRPLCPAWLSNKYSFSDLLFVIYQHMHN